MSSVLNWFDNSPWLNIISLLIGVLGIFLAYYFYHKAKKDKAPVFSRQTFYIIRPNLATRRNIEVRYKDKKVEKLTLTRLAFWNNGKEPIRREDISSSDPLKIIATDNVNIFDIEIKYQNQVNNFSIEKRSDNSADILFDFVNYNDGIVLDIYHNGDGNESVYLKGTFIGAKAISAGIKKDMIAKKIDILLFPINKWANSKKILLRILGWLLILPTIVIVLPLSGIILPLNWIFNTIDAKRSKEFYLYDN